MSLCKHCLNRLEYCLHQVSISESASQESPSSPADLKESLNASCSICTYLWNFACKIRPDPVCPTAWESITPTTNQGPAVTFRLSGRPDNNHNFPFINTSLLLKAAVERGGHTKDTIIEFCTMGAWAFELVPKTNIRQSYANGRINRHLFRSDPGDKSSTGHTAVLAVINDWISECRGHTDCTAFKQSDWMPRRLVDTQPGRPAEFRILEGAVPEPYLTLSHRWGSAQFLQLRKRNIEWLASGQPDEVFPQTFRDALRVCRTIGVRYVWIDSLCIIQDDAQDWAEQAVQLSSVYSYGLCNLAADETEADKGLFRQRISSIVTPMHYKIEKSSLPDLTAGDYELVEDRQGDDRLIWECSTWIAQEAQPFGVEVNGTENFPSRSKSLEVFNARANGATVKNDNVVCGINCDFCEQWRIIVHDFTDTALTKTDDRPMALAGLAHRVQDMSGEDYCLSMWKDHLRHQLMWAVDTGGYVNHLMNVSTGSTRQYPSFSWLSMDGGIEFPRQDARMTREYDFEISAVDVPDLKVLESRRLIQKGKLKILGTLRSVSFCKEQDNPPGQARYSMTRRKGTKLTTNVFPPSFDNSPDTMANIAHAREPSDYFLMRLTSDTVLRKTSDGYGKPWYEV